MGSLRTRLETVKEWTSVEASEKFSMLDLPYPVRSLKSCFLALLVTLEPL